MSQQAIVQSFQGSDRKTYLSIGFAGQLPSPRQRTDQPINRESVSLPQGTAILFYRSQLAKSLKALYGELERNQTLRLQLAAAMVDVIIQGKHGDKLELPDDLLESQRNFEQAFMAVAEVFYRYGCNTA